MPCYTVQTCTVNLDNAKMDLLEKALKKLGYQVWRSGGQKGLSFSKDGVSGSYYNNKLNFQYSQGDKKPDTDAIKRAYADEAIRAKAAEYAEQGWELEKDGEDYVLTAPTHGYGVVHA